MGTFGSYSCCSKQRMVLLTNRPDGMAGHCKLLFQTFWWSVPQFWLILQHSSNATLHMIAHPPYFTVGIRHSGTICPPCLHAADAVVSAIKLKFMEFSHQGTHSPLPQFLNIKMTHTDTHTNLMILPFLVTFLFILTCLMFFLSDLLFHHFSYQEVFFNWNIHTDVSPLLYIFLWKYLQITQHLHIQQSKASILCLNIFRDMINSA